MSVRQTKHEAARARSERGDVGAAVHAAVDRGFVVGRHVNIGVVPGVVIGYNIARCGRYRGHRYPLLVKTELGLAKCGLDEVAIADVAKEFQPLL